MIPNSFSFPHFAVLLVMGSAFILGAPLRAEVPAPPFLNPIPALTQWTVQVEPATRPADLSPEQEAARAATERYFPPLESIVGYKDERLSQEISSWKGGSQTLAFVVGGVLYRASSPRHPDDVVVMNPSVDGVDKRALLEFPDLVWVGEASYRKTVREKGREYHYHEEVAAEGRPARRAWIDALTRLPLRYEDGTSIYSYSYASAPRREIVIPEPFQKAIRSHQP